MSGPAAQGCYGKTMRGEGLAIRAPDGDRTLPL